MTSVQARGKQLLQTQLTALEQVQWPGALALSPSQQCQGLRQGTALGDTAALMRQEHPPWVKCESLLDAFSAYSSPAEVPPLLELPHPNPFSFLSRCPFPCPLQSSQSCSSGRQNHARLQSDSSSSTQVSPLSLLSLTPRLCLGLGRPLTTTKTISSKQNQCWKR